MTEPTADCTRSVTRCSVDGCSRPRKTLQLCEMHYVRQRRAGSPHATGRPGPAPDPYREFCRQLFSDWSDRTFSRYFATCQLLSEMGGPDLRAWATARATRANGSINLSKLENIALILEDEWRRGGDAA